MNKASFRLAFLTVLASSLSGCASPMRLFAKKPQPFEEYVAQRKAEQARIAGNQTAPSGQVEIAELLHKGHAAFQQGNLQEAQQNYWAVVQRQPQHPVANHRLGVIADREQDYATAQRHYFTALQAAPRDANLLNDIGYSYLLQSRYAEAEQFLQRALQQNSTQSNAINNLGLVYAKQGQPDRAMALFRRTNSEAEAQAKLARLLPSGAGAVSPPGSMIANQSWPPQNTGAMNAVPYNTNPYNTAVQNSNSGWNGEQMQGHALANVPNTAGQFNPQSANLSNGGWNAPDALPPNGSSPIAQAGANMPPAAINDPNMPEATRRLKEQMDYERQRAVGERQARDNAERQRREMLARQLRDEELARVNGVTPNVSQGSPVMPIPRAAPPNIQHPLYSRPSGPNTWNGTPNSAPNFAPNPNAPIVIGPPPSNPNTSPAWQGMTPGSSPPSNGAIAIEPTNSSGSPLDSMPTWPQTDSLPAITPSYSSANPNASPSTPNRAQWPNALPSGPADDSARAASRMGMSAGPGNLFPITPRQNFAPSSSSNEPNSTNGFAPNGVSPTTPSNWPANPNQPGDGPVMREPPAGSFGPGNFGTSQNVTPQLPESAAQFALQNPLPPSEQYQTPSRFGVSPAAPGTQAQAASFAPNRGASGIPAPQSQFAPQSYPTPDPVQQARYLERAGTRATVPDRFGGDDRWEQGPAPNANSSQSSAPIMQGFLSTPMGENSLSEYERMIQQHNAETNLIRQQLDAQRQLPGSENYYRSRTQPQTGTPTGPSPRPQ